MEPKRKKQIRGFVTGLTIKKFNAICGSSLSEGDFDIRCVEHLGLSSDEELILFYEEMIRRWHHFLETGSSRMVLPTIFVVELFLEEYGKRQFPNYYPNLSLTKILSVIPAEKEKSDEGMTEILDEFSQKWWVTRTP